MSYGGCLVSVFGWLWRGRGRRRRGVVGWLEVGFAPGEDGGGQPHGGGDEGEHEGAQVGGLGGERAHDCAHDSSTASSTMAMAGARIQ